MKKLNQDIIDILEGKGFWVEDVEEQSNGIYVELGQNTPEGEDWSEIVWFDGTNEDFINQFVEVATNFDVDEAVEPWIDMRGQNGVPNSIRDLLDDADWKKDLLIETASELQQVELEEE